MVMATTTQFVKYSADKHWEYVRDSQAELYALNFLVEPEKKYDLETIFMYYAAAELGTVDYYAYVLLIDGQPKGFYVFVNDDQMAYLAQIFVDSEIRGKGYGAVLLEHFEQRAAEVATELVLDMSDVNTQALNFYQAKGYVTVSYDTSDMKEPRRKMAKLLE